MRLTFRMGVCVALLAVVGCDSAYRSMARELGMPKATCTREGDKVTLSSEAYGQAHRLTFTIGQRVAWIDGVQVYLNKPAGAHEISREDIRMLRDCLASPTKPTAPLCFLLDPGHGGKDSGCQANGMQEQAITLAVAKEVQALLQAHGHSAGLTRLEEKKTLTLDERSLQGAQRPWDAFVSIHVNATGNAEAKGVETYTLPAFGCEGTLPNSPPRGALVGHGYLPMSTRLAYSVQSALLGDKTSIIGDRGVRHAHFKVLRDTPAPAILIEIGFITNPTDYARITDKTQQKQIAEKITHGILAAFSLN